MPYDVVTAGILLAPTWHDRFDSRAIIVHDDHSRTAVVEDTDTLAIELRRLRLPFLAEQWLDRTLLRQKRALFG